MTDTKNPALAQPDTLPEGYRMTELGPLPEEWEVVRLEEVASLERGVSWSKSDESSKGLGVLSIPNILNGGALNPSPRVHLSKNVPSQKLLNQDDILLVSSSGSVKNVGRPGWVKEKPLKPTTFASFITRLRAYPERLSQRFAFYLIQSPWIDFSRFTKRAADGKYNLQLLHLKSSLIPLPPLPEQRAIAHVLRTVQEAKEATERVIAAAKELKKSLMRHLFTYGPVPIDQADQVPLQDTEIGPLPAHWRVARLGEVAALRLGRTPSRALPYYWTNGVVPWVSVGDLNNGLVVNTKEQISEAAHREVFKGQLTPPGTLLFSFKLTIGKVGILGIPAVHNEAIASLYPSEQAHRDFLFYLLQSLDFDAYLDTYVKGKTLNKDKLKQLPIPLPPLPEQEEIARILRTVDEKIQVEEKRKQALEGLFKSLLHHLMTAKVRLPVEYVEQFQEKEA